MTGLPGIRWGYHRSLRDAEGLTTVSKALQRYMQSNYPGKPVTAIESTISPKEFIPHPKVRTEKIPQFIARCHPHRNCRLSCC